MMVVRSAVTTGMLHEPTSLRWMAVASSSILCVCVSECSQAGVTCEKLPTSQLGRSGNRINRT